MAKRFIDCDFVNPDYELMAQSHLVLIIKKVENEQDMNGLFKSLDYDNSINLIEIIIDKDLFPTYSSRR